MRKKRRWRRRGGSFVKKRRKFKWNHRYYSMIENFALPLFSFFFSPSSFFALSLPHSLWNSHRENFIVFFQRLVLHQDNNDDGVFHYYTTTLIVKISDFSSWEWISASINFKQNMQIEINSNHLSSFIIFHRLRETFKFFIRYEAASFLFSTTRNANKVVIMIKVKLKLNNFELKYLNWLTVSLPFHFFAHFLRYLKF